MIDEITHEKAVKLGYRDIEGYEGHYMVDDKGNVFSLKRKKIMTPCKSNNGYMQVHLSIDGVMKSHKIHRLVAKTFIPNPYNCCLGNKKSHKGYVWKYTNNIEKQTPKKPIDNIERKWFECPTCGRFIVTYYAGERHHCKCGQALNWEGIK